MNNPIDSVCDICENEFKKRPNAKTNNCAKCQGKLNYRARIKTKSCVNCGDLFEGTDKKILCPNCKRNPPVHEIIQQEILCGRCGSIIEVVEKKLTSFRVKLTRTTEKICKECKTKTFAARSEYMKSDANPTIQRLGRKAPVIKRSKEEVRKFLSDRMKGDGNPMKNPEIKLKAYNTTKERNKTRCWARGDKHHLWKGNRERFSTIRGRLYKPWVFPNLTRANFSCEICGATKTKLEVHHLSETFRSIMSRMMNGKSINDYTQDEFEELSNLICKAHENVTGIVVCPDCHRSIDDRRR